MSGRGFSGQPAEASGKDSDGKNYTPKTPAWMFTATYRSRSPSSSRDVESLSLLRLRAAGKVGRLGVRLGRGGVTFIGIEGSDSTFLFRFDAPDRPMRPRDPRVKRHVSDTCRAGSGLEGRGLEACPASILCLLPSHVLQQC